MADLSTAVCSVCGRLKYKVNHWLVAISKPGFEGLIIQASEACEDPRNPEFTYTDLCGDGCVQSTVQHYLDELHRFFKEEATAQEADTQ